MLCVVFIAESCTSDTAALSVDGLQFFFVSLEQSYLTHNLGLQQTLC